MLPWVLTGAEYNAADEHPRVHREQRARGRRSSTSASSRSRTSSPSISAPATSLRRRSTSRAACRSSRRPPRERRSSPDASPRTRRWPSTSRCGCSRRPMTQSWRVCSQEAWADDETSEAQVAANRVGVQRYSWDNAARMYLELFERLHDEAIRPRGRAFVSAVKRLEPEPGRRAFIPMAEPSIGEREIELVADAVRSGWVSSIGEYVTAFEEELASRCGVAHAIATSNGTTALHLALAVAGHRPRGRGDRALAHVRRDGSGGSLRRRVAGLCGVGPGSLVCRSRDVANRITSRTRALRRRRSLRPSRGHGRPRRDRGGTRPRGGGGRSGGARCSLQAAAGRRPGSAGRAELLRQQADHHR